MPTDIPDEVKEMVREEVGDSLRTMGVYSETGLEFSYLREDVEDAYRDREYSRISEKFLQEAFDSSRIEELFHAGETHYLTYGLEDAIVYQYVSSPLTKFFFSVDADVQPLPKQVGDRLIEYVREKRQPVENLDRVPADELQELFLD